MTTDQLSGLQTFTPADNSYMQNHEYQVCTRVSVAFVSEVMDTARHSFLLILYVYMYCGHACNLPPLECCQDWFLVFDDKGRMCTVTTLQQDAFPCHQTFKMMKIHAHIKTIENGAFRGLPNLNHLILEMNKIESLHANTFMELGVLEKLYLTSNRIR